MAAPERITVHDVARSTEIDRRGRGNLTAFADGDLLRIRGWAIGSEAPAVEVTVLAGDPAAVVGQAAISLPRPDLATAGEIEGAERSGFALALQPNGSGTSQLAVEVEFADGDRALLGTVRVESLADADDAFAWADPDDDGTAKVLPGRDGWLFLRGDSDDVIGQHTGRIALSDDAKGKLRTLLARRMDVLGRLGATWLVLVVPDKEAVYAENLPPEVVPAARRPVHDLLDIAEELGAPVLYALDELTAEKDGDLYMRTDTHWNHRGAYVAYRLICRELRSMGVELDTLPETSIEWFEKSTRGDLGGKLQPAVIEGRDVGAKIDRAAGGRILDNEVRNHGRVVIYEQDREDGPTCVVFGESFAITLLFFLKESFRRLVFVHTSTVVPEIVALERPDVVLSVPVERFLVRVPDDTEAFAALHATARGKNGELPWPLETPAP